MREHEDPLMQQSHDTRLADLSSLLRTSWMMIFVFWVAWLAGMPPGWCCLPWAHFLPCANF